MGWGGHVSAIHNFSQKTLDPTVLVCLYLIIQGQGGNSIISISFLLILVLNYCPKLSKIRNSQYRVQGQNDNFPVPRRNSNFRTYGFHMGVANIIWHRNRENSFLSPRKLTAKSWEQNNIIFHFRAKISVFDHNHSKYAWPT